MLKDISTKFLLRDIVVHGSCFFSPEPGNKISPCCVSERFMSGVSKVPQNKYIKSSSEILSIMGMLMPVLGAWRETPENTVIFFWMRGVFTCTCSCHFLLCSHFQQECHRDLLFYPAELKVMFCSWWLISSLCKKSALKSTALHTLECRRGLI